MYKRQAHEPSVGKVGDIVADLAAFQGVGGVVVMNDDIPGEVEKADPVLHQVEALLVDHLLGVFLGGYMDGDVVAFGKHGVQVFADAVSYTHLDVYKRQSYDRKADSRTQGQEGKADAESPIAFSQAGKP